MTGTIPISIRTHLDVLAQENGLPKGTDVWSAVGARPDRAIRFIRGGFSIELKKRAQPDSARKNSHTLIVRDIAAGLIAVSVEIAFGNLFATADINTIVKLNQAAHKARNIMNDEARRLSSPSKIPPSPMTGLQPWSAARTHSGRTAYAQRGSNLLS